MRGEILKFSLHRKLKFITVLAALGTALLPSFASAERFVFIPLDNRPVTRDYIIDTFRDAGCEIVTPDESLLASKTSRGDAPALQTFLEKNASGMDGAVVSLDSLIYGGLTTSRTHEFSEAELQKRLDSVLTFRQRHPGVPLYGFVTIMRSPKYSRAPEEPAYFAQWSPKLFEWGALRDRSELGLLSKKEKKQLAALEAEIPQDVQQDLLARRDKNRRIILACVDAVKSGKMDYLLIGRDDSAPYSEAHRDARAITERIGDMGYKIRSFPGADELGMTLLNRALNKSRGTTPIVYPFYTEGVGSDTVSSLEDISVGQNVREHVLAAGGYPALLKKRADVVLAVHTPVDGVTRGADTAFNTSVLKPEETRFLDRIEDDVKAGRNVSVADVAFTNGSSDALVKGLFDRKLPDGTTLAYDLGAYAGWNTCGNTLGYAIGQGMTAPLMSPEAHREMLDTRYLDDWAYQAHARQDVRYNLTFQKGWENAGAMTTENTKSAEAYVTKSLKETAAPLLGKTTVDKYQYTFPWRRTFEVKVARTTNTNQK